MLVLASKIVRALLRTLLGLAIINAVAQVTDYSLAVGIFTWYLYHIRT